MKKLLLYDLDGTLVDTRRDIVAAANFALQELGERPLSPEAVEGRVGRGLRELISGILPPGEDPKRIERGMKIYRDHYRAHLLDHAVVYEGVREFLEYFKERSQAVITNKPDPFSEEILRGLGLAHYFFSIVPGDGAFPRKPKPDSILAMMTETGAGRAETIYIGDSEVDIETARNAGIEVAVVSQGFSTEEALRQAAPDHLASGFQRLLEHAQAEGW